LRPRYDGCPEHSRSCTQQVSEESPAPTWQLRADRKYRVPDTDILVPESPYLQFVLVRTISIKVPKRIPSLIKRQANCLRAIGTYPDSPVMVEFAK